MSLKLIICRAIGCLVWAALVSGMLMAGAHGRDGEAVPFAVPRASLAEVLTQIGSAGRATISAPAELVTGFRAGPIDGRTTVEAALSRALAGTGLVAVRGDDGVYLIRRAGEETAAGETSAPAGDVPVIDVIDTANRHGDAGFQAGDAGSVAQIAAPLREVPLAVAAATEDFIRSQAVADPQGLTRALAGVVPLSSGGFNIRGFNVFTRPLVDGRPVRKAPPVDFLDRVEVLKGPTSILTGLSADGGIVQYLEKTADGEQRREVTTRFDTEMGRTAAVDLGGRSSAVEGLDLRFLATGAIGDPDGLETRARHDAAAEQSIAWRSDAYTLTAGFSARDSFDDQSPFYTRERKGQGLFGPRTKVDPAAYQSDDPWGTVTRTMSFRQRQTVDLGTLAGMDVTLGQQFSYARHDGRIHEMHPLVVSGIALDAEVFDIDETDIESRVDAAFRYTGDTVSNELRVMADLTIEQSDIRVHSASYLTPNGTFELLPDGAVSVLGSEKTIGGLSVVDKLDLLNDRLHLFGYVAQNRWDVVSSSRFTIGGFLLDDLRSTMEGSGTSWSVGAVYDLTDWASVYASWGRGLQPGEVSATGRILPPTKNQQYEAGLRFDLFDKALSVTASAYDQTKANVPISDFNAGTTLLIESQRSRGVELQVAGRPIDNLDVMLALSYVDASFDGLIANKTSVVSGIPHVAGSLWGVYTFEEGSALEGFSLGFGLRGNSGTSATLVDAVNRVRPRETWSLPGYVIADAAIGYRSGDWTISLKAENLFDTFALQSTAVSAAFEPETARTLTLEARARF